MWDRAPAGLIMKRYENPTMGWLRGVNAFKLMPAPEPLFFFFFFPVRLPADTSSHWDTWREKIRGGGRERERKKNQNWPATELNQMLEQLSRPLHLKSRLAMKIQLHDHVTRLAAAHLPSLTFVPSWPLLDDCAKIFSTHMFAFYTLPSIMRNTALCMASTQISAYYILHFTHRFLVLL